MAVQRRKEVLTETEIIEKVQELTLEIRHAKIECEADNFKREGKFPKIDEKSLNDLENLEMAIKEYKVALRERNIRLRDSFRDSGISLDRSSTLSRDSFPVQEIGDTSPVFYTQHSDMATASCPIEHAEETGKNEGFGQFTETEERTLRRHGDCSSQRRTGKERKNISSQTIPE